MLSYYAQRKSEDLAREHTPAYIHTWRDAVDVFVIENKRMHCTDNYPSHPDIDTKRQDKAVASGEHHQVFRTGTNLLLHN